jgi:23S rRNA G2445 N2-methylase RlmL
MSVDARIRDRIARLDSDDPAATRQAGDDLLKIGEPAAPELARALQRGGVEARKAAAFLLGRLGAGRTDARTALQEALRDEEPKVRKNAAVALGRIGDESSAAALAEALSAEDVRWVRPSLILALGRLRTPESDEALRELQPQSAAESDALRKALDRIEDAPPVARWKDAPPGGLFAAAPPGLEDVAQAEAAERCPGPSETIAPGLIRLPGATPPDEARSLRCVYDVRLLLADHPSLRDTAPDALPPLLSRLLAETPFLAEWRRWIDAEEAGFRYRFALEGLRVPKRDFLATLSAVREQLQSIGWRDSPSRYSGQIIVSAGQDRTRVWLVPTFPADRRFAYREADVGASIHPVVAACLARLVRTGPRAVVLDPTCGSGTLLIERGMLDPDSGLLGLDVSPTAVRAAARNAAAAGMSERLEIQQADAQEQERWRPATEVIANLPFGLRTRQPDRSLQELYRAILANLARSLAPDGRAVLYTASRQVLDQELRRVSNELRVAERRVVQAGGLHVGAWVLTPSPAPAGGPRSP